MESNMKFKGSMFKKKWPVVSNSEEKEELGGFW